ncbi:hypothetical protein SASPL_104904 [Salvia splendens]|uniref:Uncharacterized protein n=1 Tax=Salvia splendens TaxID=180675 RepID=A0A8X8YIW9_SALSN|nr:uncharacterized protein LOC121774577 [Salvia splendens]KAG6433296.1 hypothetical protein SASPL_104904 [Salvia splendens]
MDQFGFNGADVWSTTGDQKGSKESISNTGKAQQKKSEPVNIPGWSSRARVGDYSEKGTEGMPPHEYLAKTRGASPSVHEGKGRTLKGRDLSNVRDAVWKQAGFQD